MASSEVYHQSECTVPQLSMYEERRNSHRLSDIAPLLCGRMHREQHLEPSEVCHQPQSQ